MNEIWIETGNNKGRRGDSIVAISNMGRIKRKNGTIEESTLYQKIKMKGKNMLIHRFIAKHFIPKTNVDKALGRNHIDHITHNPTDINVNDVRNLRWCTYKENDNFSEAKNNKSKAKLNKPTSEFGRKYLEHYGYSRLANINQYDKERKYYRSHHKCRWE